MCEECGERKIQARKKCHNCYMRWYKRTHPEYREYAKKRRREWYHNEGGRDTQRNTAFQKAYGISLADYEQMLVEQDGRCAICGQPPKDRRLAVDHDHETGRVRGLLCYGHCNRAIGLLRDNPELLRRAAEYLERASAR